MPLASIRSGDPDYKVTFESFDTARNNNGKPGVTHYQLGLGFESTSR
jgi:hypothetical protein